MRLLTSILSTLTLALIVTGTARADDIDVRQVNLSLVNSEELLKKVAALPVYHWQDKAPSADVGHIGPHAKEFYEAFGVGHNDTISANDLAGIALAAIQALSLENAALKAKVAEIDKIRDELKRSNEILESLSLLVRKLPVGPETSSGSKDLAVNKK